MGGRKKRFARFLAQGTIVGLLLAALAAALAFGGDETGAKVDDPGFTDGVFTGPSIVPSLFDGVPIKTVAIDPANKLVVGPGIVGGLPGVTDGVLAGPSILPSLLEGVPTSSARVTLPALRVEAPGITDGLLTGPSIVPGLFAKAPINAVEIDPAGRIVVGPAIVGGLPGFTDGVLTGPSIVSGLFPVTR